MTSQPAAIRSERGARKWPQRTVLTAGLIFITFASIVSAGFYSYLPRVDPSADGHGLTYPASAVDRWWLAQLLLTAVGAVACSGLPSAGARATNRAVVQGLGGGIVIGITALEHAFLDSFYFISPKDGCYYASCWPLRHQMFASLVPTLVLGLLMIGGAVLARRIPWSVRALGPPVVWVVLVLVQHEIWRPALLPLFQGPPP